MLEENKLNFKSKILHCKEKQNNFNKDEESRKQMAAEKESLLFIVDEVIIPSNDSKFLSEDSKISEKKEEENNIENFDINNVQTFMIQFQLKITNLEKKMKANDLKYEKQIKESDEKNEKNEKAIALMSEEIKKLNNKKFIENYQIGFLLLLCYFLATHTFYYY
jgi:hypothetical protein